MIYEAICLGSVGRTFGKVVLGLLVVHSHDGKPLTVSQAIYRSILINIPFLTVIGAFLSLLREDRRGLVDIVVQTTVVYAWDAHSFRLAEKEWARDMVFGDLEANTRLDSSEMEDEEESSISTASTPKRRKGGPHGRRPVKTRVLRTPVEERLNHTGSFVSHASKVSTTMEENA